MKRKLRERKSPPMHRPAESNTSGTHSFSQSCETLDEVLDDFFSALGEAGSFSLEDFEVLLVEVLEDCAHSG